MAYVNQVKPAVVPGGAQGSIPVIARLVLLDGSEEWWPARAVRWTRTEVLIARQLDPTDSLSVRHLWLPVGDVARVLRRAPEA